MGKTDEDWNGSKLGFLKTVQPNSFSKLIPVACNFRNNAQETYLFVLDLFLSFTCNFFAYFKFHCDWGRVNGKIKQNELDCRDSVPLSPKLENSSDLWKNFGKTKLVYMVKWDLLLFIIPRTWLTNTAVRLLCLTKELDDFSSFAQ